MENETTTMTHRPFSLRRAAVSALNSLGLKDAVRFFLDLGLLAIGISRYWVTGKTPSFAHHALVRAFCYSGGRVNDVLAFASARVHPPYRFPEANGILGNLGEAELAAVRKELDEKGWFVFERRIPSEICDRLAEKARQVDCWVTSDEILADKSAPKLISKFDPRNPLGPRYNIPGQWVTELPEIQDLLKDYSLLAVAQSYLRAKPVVTQVGMAWSAATKDVPDVESAQMFHFDLERIRWLRYFIYLTDVDEDQGPHCFVEGSHRTGAIPRDLLKAGYARLSDEEVMRHYPRSSYKEFVGKKGMILAEDSRGFHKGKHHKSGSRLLVDFEITSSMFGSVKRRKMEKLHSPELAKMIREYPRVYANFDFSGEALEKIRS